MKYQKNYWYTTKLNPNIELKCSFMFKEMRSNGELHKGTDWVLKKDKNEANPPLSFEIYSPINGVVVYAQWKPSGFGYLIKILGDDGVMYYFGHLSQMLVQKGQRVTEGQKICISGTTGNSTGIHLHFEGRKPDNPNSYIDVQDKLLLITKYEMVILQKNLKLKCLGNPKIEVRQEPSSKALDVGDCLFNTVWEINRVANGELVKQNGRESSTWYWFNVGWVNACWVDEISPSSDCEIKLAQANKDIETLKTKIGSADAKVVEAHNILQS